jgi:hypothetical protein
MSQDELEDAMAELIPMDSPARHLPPSTDLTPAREAHRDRIVAWHSAEMRARYDAGQKANGGDLFAKRGMLAHALEENIDQAFYMRTLGGQISDIAAALRSGAFTNEQAAEALDRLLTC